MNLSRLTATSGTVIASRKVTSFFCQSRLRLRDRQPVLYFPGLGGTATMGPRGAAACLLCRPLDAAARTPPSTGSPRTVHGQTLGGHEQSTPPRFLEVEISEPESSDSSPLQGAGTNSGTKARPSVWRPSRHSLWQQAVITGIMSLSRLAGISGTVIASWKATSFFCQSRLRLRDRQPVLYFPELGYCLIKSSCEACPTRACLPRCAGIRAFGP